jgi:putative two-component system response regulator
VSDGEKASLFPEVQEDYEKQTEAPFTDSLTGLYNHGFFDEFLGRELKRFLRYAVPFSLALLDIDGLGRYNSRRGSIKGDRALKEVGAIIREGLRESDLAARYLGDVFAVLLLGAPIGDAETVVRRVGAAIEKRFEGELTVCIGCASSEKTLDKDELIRKAMGALVHAKANGKGSVCLADSGRPPALDGRSRVLIVDDEPVNARILKAMLKPLNCDSVVAGNGEEALQALTAGDIDLVLLDAMMPRMDGFEACRRLKSDPATRIVPVIMITGLDDAQSKIRAIEAGADDFITKPPDRVELSARVRALIRAKRLNDSLVSIENVLFSLASAVEAKDAYTEGHVRRVSSLAVNLGRAMDLPPRDIDALRVGGILHDIGKIGIPDSVLSKPAPLSPEEVEAVRNHPVVGCRMAEPLAPTLKGALDVIRHHHEKLDGSGYPDGLKGADISAVARIMAVADVYDALVTDRPYRRGMTKEEALATVQREADEGLLDAAAVSHLTALLRREDEKQVAPPYRFFEERQGNDPQAS